jgi:hypothetical protein
MEVARASGGRRIIHEAAALVPILGSLIAQGKAKPMIVVMPLGYGTMEFVELECLELDREEAPAPKFLK